MLDLLYVLVACCTGPMIGFYIADIPRRKAKRKERAEQHAMAERWIDELHRMNQERRRQQWPVSLVKNRTG